MKKSLLVALSVATGITMVGCNSTDKSEKETVIQEVVVQEEVTQTDAANTDVIEVAETQVVTGSVGYRERIALPENAVITVTLADVSLADAPSKTISEQTFEAAEKSSPFDYSLEFDTADIQANHSYSVRATIKVDGKLRFTTDTNYAVITDEAKTMQQDLMLKGVRQ
ncbi:MAG: hypothetical protein GY920_06190 [Aliivibrio sp.]|nr:hypothetical protein [Aliivibrio sp.]